MFVAKRVLRSTLTRFYSPDYIVTPSKKGHWADPDDVRRRLVNIFIAHDAIQDPSKVTGKADFKKELNLHDFDIVEIFLEVERDFFMEFTDEQVDTFHSIEDAVEAISSHRFVDNF
jgi:acyl carrier protein